MSQFYQYRNALLAADSWVEVLTGNVRLGGLSLTTQAEHLQVGTSSIILDDPDADLGHDGDTILGLHRFELIEDDATDDEHIVISFITDVKFRRGDSDRSSLRTGTERQIEVSLVDLNTIPTLVVIDPDDADAKRPAETIDDRLAWLLASDYLLGRVHDDGVVESNTTMMDAAEYGGQTAANVIGDCELAAGFGWNAWIYYLEDAGHYSLGFINANTSTLYSSDLRISNLLSDLDTLTVSGFESGTTFAPLYEAELTRDYSSVISGVHVAWSGGGVFRERDATKDIYGPREQTAPDSNIKNATTAERIANDYLFQHSTPADNIHVAIEVPTSKANAIKAGQRLEVKFTHLPGYESFTWCRVIRRTIIQEQATDRYVIDMDLSPQEAGPPVPAGASIVQSVFGRISAGASLTFPHPVTVGNLLVFCISDRNFSDPTGPFTEGPNPTWGSDAWTRLPNVTAGQRDDGVSIYYKTADSTSAEGWIGATDAVCGCYEIAGADIGSATTASKDEQAPTPTMDIGSLGTPAANSVNIMVGLWFDEKHTSDPTYPGYVPRDGWTLDFFSPAAYAGIIEWDAPLSYIAHNVSDGTAVTAGGTRSGLLNRTGEWGGAAISIPPA